MNKETSKDTSVYLAMIRKLYSAPAIAGVIWEASGLLKIKDNHVCGNDKLGSKHKPVKIDPDVLVDVKTLLNNWSNK